MMPWEKLDPTAADVPQLVAHAERVRYDHQAGRWVGDLDRDTARAIVRALLSVAADLTRSIPETVALADDAWELRVEKRDAEDDGRWTLGVATAGVATLANQATGAAYMLAPYAWSDRDAGP